MDYVASLHPTPQAWLRNSALAPHIDAYAAYLRQGRYASVTTRGYLTCVAHFAHWMSQGCLQVPQVEERSIRQFLDEHLRNCNCPGSVMRVYGDLRAALGHLLLVLRAQGAISMVAEPTGPIADELHRYDDHMCNARGLTTGTRRGQLRIIGRLLLHKFSDRPVVISKLQPSDVRQFIAVQMKLVDTVSNAFTLASALRSYLRYRATCGDQVQGLFGAISSPAHWGLASLPRAFKPVDVERLLASFTPEIPSSLEQQGQAWAGDMIEVLTHANHTDNLNCAQGKTPNFESAKYQNQVRDLRDLYDAVLAQAEQDHPVAQPNAKRGRTKQSKAVNLIGRLRQYSDDVWRFMTQANVPFTNNLAEQAVRMPKVKQKVSGCFRTAEGAHTYCVIRSYVATMQKQGGDVFAALVSTFKGHVPPAKLWLRRLCVLQVG